MFLSQDVSLSPTGEREALAMAKQISNYFYDIDVCFTSMLSRSQQTTRIVLEKLWEKQQSRPDDGQRKHHFRGSHAHFPPLFPRIVHCDYQLNERHYGALQGFVKKDVADGKCAAEIPGSDDPNLVASWRRSWFAVPPLLTDDDPRRLEEVEKWSPIMPISKIPRGESLEMVAKDRVRPFLDDVLTPVLDEIAAYKHSNRDRKTNVQTTGLVIAHANSLRALLGVLCEVEDDPEALQILEALRIPTGVPLVVYYQQCTNGKYRALPLPEADNCIIQYDNGQLVHPRQPPPGLGHPKLPVWPLDTCIPLHAHTAGTGDEAAEIAREPAMAAARFFDY